MSLTETDVKKIAKLARIKLTEAEVVNHQNELNKIFNWIENLQSVNTDSVLPMFSVDDRDLVMRADVATNISIRNEVLKSASISKYGYFVVPKVIE